jgi:hypothetical protein
MAKFNISAYLQDLKAITANDSLTMDDAKQIRMDIARHHTLQEHFCNGFQCYNGSEDEKARIRAEGRERGVVSRLTKLLGTALAEFTGDPRGCTVKLKKWEKGNPAYDRYAETWGFPKKLTYFSHDWGDNLISVVD